jgi:NADH-quinone oxidoreductase subunit C
MVSARSETLASKINARFGERLTPLPCVGGDVAYETAGLELLEICRELRDAPELAFEQLVDLCGIDYLDYGREEWSTQDSTNTGFSRGVNRIKESVPGSAGSRRFAVVYQLLSVTHNWRVRLRCFTSGGEPPLINSVNSIWASANWYEREAFDLFGIMFQGHPDLRRLLTDYGFIGHPFRRDFPLIGNVEVKYDPVKGRVVYQPVSIEPRTLVPRVIRDDNRYQQELKDIPVGAADPRTEAGRGARG